jgi:hypothetical protein
MVLSCETEHSAQFEILAGHAVAVKQYGGRALAPFEVMEPDTLDCQESACWPMPALRLARLVEVPGRHRRS